MIRHPNPFRDTPTSTILAESEAWLWDLAELDADLAEHPDSWDYPEQSRRFMLAMVEKANEELARRERLRPHSAAPPRPNRWPDRRAEVEAIKSAIDLLRFIEEMALVRLERRGKHLVGRCPLPGHEDKTPSFTVHAEKQVFYCHGCHRGGDLFTFAMHMLGTDRFADIVPILAEEAGIARQTPGDRHVG